MSLKNIQNYYFPAWQQARTAPDQKSAQRNLGRTISPVQLQRLRQDVLLWRDCIVEAEHAYYPQRVKMQQMFQDTILEGHTWACWERRKDLTLLRDFVLVNEADKEDEKWTAFFKKPWFQLWQEYALDSIGFGYSLIAHGDLINDSFPDLTIVKRQNVSPDRLNVGAFVYSLSGEKFLEEPFADWHTWIPTPTETSSSPCGFGLFYRVALYAIFLRNLLGQNSDFVELYSQPYRIGRTSKTEEDERGELERALQMMGSSGYALLDDGDTIEFLETALGGTGYMGYDNFEQRLEKKISKLILGHADAMDSTPGKLGATQGDSPSEKALKAKKTKDGALIENTFNDVLLPKLRNIGINVPLNLKGKFKNDEEAEDLRTKEDTSNKATADIMKIISDAGGEPDWKYFSDRTGIKVEKKEVVVPDVEPITPEEEEGADKEDKAKLTKEMINKLNNIYKHKH